MNVLSNIKDHTCLIVPSSLKKKILLELSKITSYPYQIKFMDFNSLKKHLFFDYDLSAISYLMDKYHLKAEVCKVYLDNMYYIEDKNYQSNKLQSLLQLKKDLEANNLLQKDIFFSYFLDSQEVIIAGYPPLDCFQKRMVELLSKVTNVTVLEQEEQEDKVLDVYAFDTMEEEIDFVSCSILDLLEKGISLNNIKLANVTEEYYNTIKRVFSYYHLPIMLEESSIYSTAYSKVFLTTFKETESLEESFNSVKEKYPNEIELEKQLLLICNQVTVLDCSFESKLEILEYLLKNTKQQQPKLNQAIETVSFTCCEPNDDDYVFLLGINQNVFPKLYQDEDYISDNLKKEVCLPLTKEKNQLSRFWAQEMIKKIPHLIMSYKLKSPFEAYYPSSMLAELDVNIIKKPTYNKYRYSNLSNEIKLTKKLDRYRKFHEEDEDLALLQQNYSNLPYLTYQNKFTGIDKQRYLNYINHKLLLSYTSMNQYYQCAFRYYLNYVLKLNPFEDTFQAFIGNLYHKLLSLAFLSNFDFEKEFTNYLKTRDLTVSETFFLQKLKRELKQTIDIIKEQQELTNFRQELYEKEIIIPLQNEIKVLFKGTIDKIMYQEKMEIPMLV